MYKRVALKLEEFDSVQDRFIHLISIELIINIICILFMICRFRGSEARYDGIVLI